MSMGICSKWAASIRPARRTFASAARDHNVVSLVQGASRGLGLEFVRQLLEKHSDGHVIATCRNPENANNLVSLQELHPSRLSVLRLDLTDESTIIASASTIREQHQKLDLLINSSGVLHVPNLLYPETSLGKITSEAMLLTYQINAVGPTLVIKHMWPLLKAGASDQDDRIVVIANISARVGSIGDNKLGGWHSYRASKAALNQLTKTISIELARQKDRMVCILLHPGTVDTDLSKPFQKNVPSQKLFTREFSVQKLLDVIDNVGVKDNGKFFAWDGTEIPW